MRHGCISGIAQRCGSWLQLSIEVGKLCVICMMQLRHLVSTLHAGTSHTEETAQAEVHQRRNIDNHTVSTHTHTVPRNYIHTTHTAT